MNVSRKLICWNTLSSVTVTVMGGYGTFGMGRLDAGSSSPIGEELNVPNPASCPVSSSWLPTPCSSCPMLLLANSVPATQSSLSAQWTGNPSPPALNCYCQASLSRWIRKVDEYGNLWPPRLCFSPRFSASSLPLTGAGLHPQSAFFRQDVWIFHIEEPVSPILPFKASWPHSPFKLQNCTLQTKFS